MANSDLRISPICSLGIMQLSGSIGHVFLSTGINKAYLLWHFLSTAASSFVV